MGKDKVIKKTLKDKIGKDELIEVAEKDWKIAELPSEEELASENNSNPKARSNINSRKNLAQYKERDPKSKKRSLENLRVREKVERIANDRPDGDDILSMFPVDDMMDQDEQEIYFSILEMYIKDFDKDTLSAIDKDGIVTLANNRVLEKRLFRQMHEAPSTTAELMPSIEKLQKANEKIKDSLGQRRKDRIDPRASGEISILDIAKAWDDDRKQKLKEYYENEDDAVGRKEFRDKMESVIKNG